jgi:hypothetical protein
METNQFKKIFRNYMISKGFARKGSCYCQSSGEAICAIGLQRSHYSDGYYINIGYLIRAVSPNLETPHAVDGHIRARFTIVDGGKEIDLFSLEKMDDAADLCRALNSNISTLVDGYLSIEGLKTLINKKPVLLYQTMLVAKQFLGYK